MAIPDYQACMLPLLKLAGDRNDHALKDAVPTLADQFQLTDAERSEFLPSGQQRLFSQSSELGEHLFKEGRFTPLSSSRVLRYYRSRGKCSCAESVDHSPGIAPQFTLIVGRSRRLLRS
jgi:Mrr N-terminal domain